MFKHEFIEIGGIKWATMNVGAHSVTDYGLFFQWGDVKGYTKEQVENGNKLFWWNDYKFTPNGFILNENKHYGLTKYTNADGLKVLEPFDDAAHMTWLGRWRIPTDKEFMILKEATTSVFVKDYEGSGVAGLVLTSKSDLSKKLFFPAAGNCTHGIVDTVSYNGSYWSSSISRYNIMSASHFVFLRGTTYWCYFTRNRCDGLTVRPVLADE